MNKYFFNLIFLLFGAFYSTTAQDRIITTKLVYDSIPCIVSSIRYSSIIYKPLSTDKFDTVAFTGLSKWIFYNDNDILVIPRIVFDTVKGVIIKVGNEKVKIKMQDNHTVSILKQEIFVCQFSESKSIQTIDDYRRNYEMLQFPVIRLPVKKIITVKGNEIIKVHPTKIDKEKLFVYVNYPEQPTLSSSFRKDINYVNFNEFYIHRENKYPIDYLLTKEGNLQKSKLKKIDNKKLNIKISNQSGSIFLEENKDKVSGIFFYDFANKPSNNIRYKKQDYAKFDFSVIGGYANLFAFVEASGFNHAVEDNIRELKNALYVGAGINIYIRKNFGAGIYYKYLNSKASVTYNGTKYSDNIHINFIGLALVFRSRLSNTLSYKLIIAPGPVFFKNKMKIDSHELKAWGKAFGLNITNRISLGNNNGLGVFIDISYLYSIMKKWTFEKPYQSVDDDPVNLSRFEIGIGFSYAL